MADERFNVTFSGDCPTCSMTTTVTGEGNRMPVLSVGAMSADTVPCLIDGTATPMRLVGICVHPFVAADPTADDDEPQDEFEVGDAERPIDG